MRSLFILAAAPFGWAQTAPSNDNYLFGSTFPLTSSQLVEKETWQHNIFMGTHMKFNPGAYWQYTNQYYSPKQMPTATHEHTVDHTSSGQTTSAPTPGPNYEGQACFGYLQPCPSGYYCKVASGYQPGQKGQCRKAQVGTGGQGWWGNVNGIAPTPKPIKTIADLSGGNNWFSNTQNSSCAAPSVCGFKAVRGDCWCDSQCHTTNDCCADIEDHCTFATAQPTPAPVPKPEAVQPPCEPRLQGDCTGKCGQKGVVGGSNGVVRCYCDATCKSYGDCCCSYNTMCVGG